MTGQQLARIRENLEHNAATFALAFGYDGSSKVRSLIIRRMETGERPIPPPIARLALLFSRHGIPEEWLNQS